MLHSRLTKGFHPTEATPHRREVFIASGGSTMALSVWPRQQGAATVVFYPGTMASPLMYTLLLESLWEQGLNVVGVHHVSHGLSPRQKICFTFEDLLQNGLDAAQWAREHLQGPVVISGHSQGGILTLAHAARDQRIAAAFPLCLLLPHHDEAASVTLFARWAAHRERLLKSLRALAGAVPFLPLTMPFYLNLRRAIANGRRCVAPSRYLRFTYPLGYVSSLFHADLRHACVAGHIKAPLTLITARDDLLFPLPLMRRMLDCVAAPRKELLTIPGGGHMFAVSRIYAPFVAAHMAARCAGLGLPLYRMPVKGGAC